MIYSTEYPSRDLRACFEQRDHPMATGEGSKSLDANMDARHNWERNGLIMARRNSYNNYRLFGKKEIERLRIVRVVEPSGLQSHGDAAHVHRAAYIWYTGISNHKH